MEGISWLYAVWAASLGALCAVSLPLGSLVGLRTTPRPVVISIMAGFLAAILFKLLE